MSEYREKLTSFINQFIFERRIERIEEVLNYRTDYITVVLEDIYQPHNASAVLRSCDCFGINNVHIIENNYEYTINPDVSMGSEKWLNISCYRKNYSDNNEQNSIKAINELKNKGYRIVATTPNKDGVSPDRFDLAKGKTAVILGSEKNGLSKAAVNLADEYLKIPIYGFTESFNISVSAAIILNRLVTRLHQTDIKWQIGNEKYADMKLDWMLKTVRKPDILIKEFKKMNPGLK